MKWVLIVIVVAIALLGGGGWFLAQAPQTEGLREQIAAKMNKAPEQTEVRTWGVERGELIRRVGAPGTIEPRTNVEISAQVSARITALPKREGELVQAGDVVVRFDARDLQARVDAAQARIAAETARLEGARARAKLAEADFNRQTQLFESGDIALGNLERAESEHLQMLSELKVIEANIDSARATLIEAQRDLDNAVIESPIDGVIIKLNAEVGELAMIGTLNNAGSIILEIADLSDMLVRARIDESNVADVRAGQHASVYVNAYADEPFEGVVERVDLVKERWTDGTFYYEAEIRIDEDPDRPLLSGMTASVELEVQSITDALLVPSQAVMDRRIDEIPRDVIDASPYINERKTYARVVFVMRDAKVFLTPVEIGASDLTDTVVFGGLEVGDRVVIGPYRVLTELEHETEVVEEGSSEEAEGDEVAGRGDAGASGEG